MATPCKWGILAPGRIARSFATGLKDTQGCELYAAASRSTERAEAFIEEFGGAKAYGSYDALLADPDVDIIYIASPHNLHAEQAVRCMDAGKPVLCEKPLAVNAAQVRAMIDASERNNIFMMEAMWTRFFPAVQEAKKMVDAGTIGEVRMLEASFGFRGPDDPSHRLLNPALAGGALLDVGVYTQAMASLFLGTPAHITGTAHVGHTGVDEQNACVLTYRSGALAVLTSAVRTTTRHECRIYGTAGTLTLPPMFWQPRQLVLEKPGEEARTIDLPIAGNGYNYQAVEAARCLAAGITESPLMPHAESLSIMETMDALRAQWGVKYPFEEDV